MRMIGEILVERKILQPAGLIQALEAQAGLGRRLASTCLALGLAKEEDLALALSFQRGAPFAVLSRSTIPREVLGRLPAGLARALPALPLLENETHLVVAVADPQDIGLLSELALNTGAHVIEHGALEGPLRAAIDAAYRSPERGFAGENASGQVRIVRANPEIASPAALDPLAGNEVALEAWDQIEPEPKPNVRSGQKRLLVVEDDPDIRRMWVAFLGKQGFEISEAEDGRAAVRFLQADLPDGVLLDGMLPGIHGFDICRMLKQADSTRDIPVIMISAVYRGKELAEEIRIEHGANVHLEKPVRLTDLNRVLNNCLAGRGAPPSRAEIAARLSESLKGVNEQLKTGDLSGASASLRRALQVAPFLPTLHYRLARLYLKLGKRYQALDHLEWTERLQPNQAAAYLLAETLEKIGLIERAREAWRRYAGYLGDPAERERVERHIDTLSELR